MTQRIQISSPLSETDAVAAIQARAKDWRESHVPVELRDEGFHAIEINVNGNSFQLKLIGGRRKRAYIPRLLGSVETSQDGSRVIGYFTPSIKTWILHAIIFLFAAFAAWSTGDLVFPVVWVVADIVLSLGDLRYAERLYPSMTRIIESAVNPAASSNDSSKQS